jgi:hypothetical protein
LKRKQGGVYKNKQLTMTPEGLGSQYMNGIFLVRKSFDPGKNGAKIF